MPEPVVVVEVSSQGQDKPGVDALLAACTSAVRRGRCVARGAQPDENIRAVVIVSWENGSLKKVKIQTVSQATGNVLWRTRELNFRASDVLVERWKAVGLVAATMVGEIAPEPEPEGPIAPPNGNETNGSGGKEDPTSEPPKKKPEGENEGPKKDNNDPKKNGKSLNTNTPKRTWFSVNLAGAVGRGVESSDARWGGYFRFGVEPMNRFRIISSVGYYLANTDDEIQAQWLTLTIGAEFTVLSLLSNTVDVNTRIEIVAERLRASVTEKSTGQSDSGVRWQPGVKVGVDGTFWWLHRLDQRPTTLRQLPDPMR